MAFFVNIEGIKGESKDNDHKEWIDVLSLGYCVSQSSSMSTGGGGGVGRADFEPISFIHYVDKATPNLMKYCAGGTHIPTVEVSCCKVGDGSKEYMRITLTDCLITCAGPSGAIDDGQMKESVSISYAKIKIEVKEQAKDGTMGAGVTGTWNVKENKEE